MRRVPLQGARIYYEPDTGFDGESYWIKVGEEDDNAAEMYLLVNGWLEVVYHDVGSSEYHPPHRVIWARGIDYE